MWVERPHVNFCPGPYILLQHSCMSIILVFQGVGWRIPEFAWPYRSGVRVRRPAQERTGVPCDSTGGLHAGPNHKKGAGRAGCRFSSLLTTVWHLRSFSLSCCFCSSCLSDFVWKRTCCHRFACCASIFPNSSDLCANSGSRRDQSLHSQPGDTARKWLS